MGRWHATGEAMGARAAYTSGSTRVASGGALPMRGGVQTAWGAWAACNHDAGAVRRCVHCPSWLQGWWSRESCCEQPAPFSVSSPHSASLPSPLSPSLLEHKSIQSHRSRGGILGFRVDMIPPPKSFENQFKTTPKLLSKMQFQKIQKKRLSRFC